MGEMSIFLDLKPHEGAAIAFGGIAKGKIFGIGKIGIPSLSSIDNVVYVEGMKYNLLSISQFCGSVLDFPCIYFLVHFFFMQICSREIRFAGKRTGSSSI